MVRGRENATMTVLDRLVRDWRTVTGVGRRTALFGVAAVLVGVVLAVSSLGVFAASEAVAGGDRYWTLRRLAGVAAATSLPVTLGGVTVLLAVRRAVVASGLGGLVSLVATGWFAAAYPTNWNGGPATATFEVAALYVVGVVVAVAALSGAVLAHRRVAGEDAGGDVERGGAFRETERGEGGFDWVNAPEQE
jgi:hypothetical protein